MHLLQPCCDFRRSSARRGRNSKLRSWPPPQKAFLCAQRSKWRVGWFFPGSPGVPLRAEVESNRVGDDPAFSRRSSARRGRKDSNTQMSWPLAAFLCAQRSKRSAWRLPAWLTGVPLRAEVESKHRSRDRALRGRSSARRGRKGGEIASGVPNSVFLCVQRSKARSPPL